MTKASVDVSRTKIAHGSTAPNASGAKIKMLQAPIRSAVFLNGGCSAFTIGAGSGCVTSAELNESPCCFSKGLQNLQAHRARNHLLQHLREQARSRRAKACRGSAIQPVCVRSRSTRVSWNWKWSL